ncbi:MAG: sulfotransferase [Flavobacteriales bacterium]|nr:sulfotransferase [Flavobacteriales bacterium]MBT6814804.1 sulfotransferase [Flavobacteriales bacterium]MBT7620303.1 sulfotransferase [Flavobacteriales bacterium]
MKVRIFIVGAPKAGTTSLHYYLNEHPEILMSSVKEPDFFLEKEIDDIGLYYGTTRIETSDKYHNLFSDKKDEEIFGESSVSYLYYPEVPKRIKEYNTEAKIIIMLRNPVDRAFSHYLMDFKLGLLSDKFEDVFNKKEGLKFQQYFLLGNYYEQVKRYLDEFTKENVHIIWYSDFKKDAEQEVKKAFEFIDVDSAYKVNFKTVHNSFFMPKGKIIRKIYSIVWLRKLLLFLFPFTLITFIKSTLFTKGKKPKITNESRKIFTEYYLNDICKLEELLSINLSEWKK